MKTKIVEMARVVPVAVATLMIVAACAATSIKGEIKDDGITLAADHAGPSVRFDLHNVGTTPCDLVPVLTSLPVEALPVKDGQVIIDESGSGGPVRPANGPGGLRRVAPGAVFQIEVALVSTPKTEDRIILCNGAGDYEHGRYAVLPFDR
jgi:hypothetical protein